ncbi:PIN domain-containing protein [candidate division KSB1 bacterium]|nr:PIN domain-containing protein [candidate division KSB1 bacterium]
MTLVDAGPLVALLDKNDARHTECVEASNNLSRAPLLTTWPCFTEAMYLLAEEGGYNYISELWKFQQTQQLLLHDLTVAEIKRMAELMKKYRDTPMDLADASLIAVAESLLLREVFTIDSDFNIYRLADGSAVKIIP